MKKLGYIHRYKQSEGYGILVYGNGYFGEWNYIPPILFDHRQCKSLIKTGQLVYFEIEDDGSIKNIEPASIYNFDRDIVLSYVSVCDSKDWHECERSTHIRYQNIAELSEWVSEGTHISISEIEDAKNDDNTVATPLDDDGILELLDDFDLIDDFLDEYDLEAHHSKGHYQRIKIPDSVVEEYKLFGRIFINEISSVATFREDDIEIQKMQNISIDILDPALWIPAKLHGKKKYYGGNATEFNDLIDIIFIRRRNALGRNLDSLRYKESDEFWKLNINFQKQLHPELFLNDCISNRWQLLLERLSEEDLKEAYQHCKLLQPILPKTFCHKYIAFLDEDYGFPDVSIAEEFLKYKVHNIHNATEYKHYMDLLHAAKNCGVEHLPDEGVPFCAIGKTKLKNITISLGRKKKNILSFIENQIRINNPNMDLVNIADYINTSNVELMLRVGEFYDFISEIVNHPYLSYYRNEEIVKAYNNLPQSIQVLLDSYLHDKLNKLLLDVLKSGELTPFRLHRTLEKLSKWIDISFLSINANVIKEVFIKTEDASDLISAFEYKYINESDFHKRYVELSKDRSDKECLSDLHDCRNYRFPEQTQIYILERILNNYGLEFSYSYGNKNYEFPGYFCVQSINDFLSWVKDNTVKYGHECISKEVAEVIQTKVMSSLSEGQNWFLFEKDIISVLNPEYIKVRLKEAYSKYDFKNKCFEKDCFQVQMANDVLHFEDIRLIKAIIDKLNPKHRKLIYDKIEGFGKLYIWALNPIHTIDWENLNDYFVELDGESQKRVFRFLFLHQSIYKDCTNIRFLNLLSNIIEGSITKLAHKEKTDIDDFFERFSPNGNTLSALAAIIFILQIKLGNPRLSIDWSELWPSLNRISSYPISFLKAIKDFFEDCNGLLLLSSYKSEDTKYYARNGYVHKIKTADTNEGLYIVGFYDTPIDIDGNPIDYLDYSDVESVEEVLKKNFKYQYVCGEYLINQKYEIRLKEFITAYRIDDQCNLFDDIFGHNENQGYGIPEHLNYLTKYNESSLFVCNCSQYKSVDPSFGIPFCWCKGHPCTRKSFFCTDKDWGKYKFVDLLWILLNDTLKISQIWEINSEIASFINTIAENFKNSNLQLSSTPLSSINEVGEWTSDMCIFTDKTYDDYDYSDDESGDDWNDDDNIYSPDDDTYERYNGSWAQDVEGYSDDDIDTIFDGDPSAYWNID